MGSIVKTVFGVSRVHIGSDDLASEEERNGSFRFPPRRGPRRSSESCAEKNVSNKYTLNKCNKQTMRTVSYLFNLIFLIPRLNSLIELFFTKNTKLILKRLRPSKYCF